MSGITVPTLDEITGHTVMAKLRSLCKKFIGLAQEVDDKIDAPLEEAHLAVETANATLATAQESLEDAQEAVTTANSATETANEASESAQESAETVAGYDTRLTIVENGKINITDINNYAVGLTGNQNANGIKTWLKVQNGIMRNSNFIRVATPTEETAGTNWFKICDIKQNMKLRMWAYSRYAYIDFVIAGSNTLQLNAVISKVGAYSSSSNIWKACLNTNTGRWEIYTKLTSGNAGGGLTISVVADEMTSSTDNAQLAVLTSNVSGVVEPVVGDDFSVVTVIL